MLGCTTRALTVSSFPVGALAAGSIAEQLEEVTAELITAKMRQAELANDSMSLSHEKRQLEKQLVIDVEMHEVDYLTHPAAADRLQQKTGVPKRKSIR